MNCFVLKNFFFSIETDFGRLFFQDWWNDFDLQTYSKDFTRQISNEAPKRTMLDNFFDLKMGRDLDTSLTSSKAASKSQMKLKDGQFSIEVDTQDFDPEDLDICVEGNFLIIKGEREVKRGHNTSRRVFNQRFDLPSGVDVDKITSEYKLNGKLVVTAPTLGNLEFCH